LFKGKIAGSSFTGFYVTFAANQSNLHSWNAVLSLKKYE